MNEIIRHTEYLITAHDCVVIPGLGAVLVHDRSASYDASRQVIAPPSRTFSFNASLTHNDGLLVSSVARSRSIPFDVARRIVAGEVDAMRRALEADGSLMLGHLGCLYLVDGLTLSFEPAVTAALSPRHMWLQSIDLRPVAELVRQRELLAAGNANTARPFVSYVNRAVRVAASLALLFALGFVLSTPIKFDKAQYASLGIENFVPSETSVSEQSSLIRRPGEATSDITLYLRAHNDASETVDTAAHSAYIRERMAAASSAAKAVHDVSSVRFEPSDPYCLVVASLVTEVDAQDYIDNIKNQQLGILAKDGRYRVYAATGATSRQAQSAAATLADRFPGAWVCRK